MSHRPRVAIVELDDRDRRGLARRRPEASGYATAFAVVAAADAKDVVGRVLAALADAVNEGERVRADRLVESLLPPVDVPTPKVLEGARQEAVRRSRMLRDFGAVTATQLAELSGSTAGNRSQLAYRLRREGRVFSVPYQGATYYFGFQFDDDGHPLPAVAGVLRVIGGWAPWEIARWFVRPHGLLDRRRPVELLASDPDRVVEAAEQSAPVGAGRVSSASTL